jgi:hypothetical protein
VPSSPAADVEALRGFLKPPLPPAASAGELAAELDRQLSEEGFR